MVKSGGDTLWLHLVDLWQSLLTSGSVLDDAAASAGGQSVGDGIIASRVTSGVEVKKEHHEMHLRRFADDWQSRAFKV